MSRCFSRITFARTSPMAAILLLRQIAVELRQIERWPGGKLHDSIPHVDVVPASGALATVDLDAPLVLADQHVFPKRRNQLIVSTFADAVHIFRRRRKDLNQKSRIRDRLAIWIGGIELNRPTDHGDVRISRAAGRKNAHLQIRLENVATSRTAEPNGDADIHRDSTVPRRTASHRQDLAVDEFVLHRGVLLVREILPVRVAMSRLGQRGHANDSTAPRASMPRAPRSGRRARARRSNARETSSV